MFAKDFIKRLLRDTRGATAVEYGIILAMIVIGMIAALQSLASETIDMWTDVSDDVEAVNNGDVS
ncbi:Flp family type IVb pilin [Aurantiacibacter odishensis]|uniref:Flp family type IVb pilin n=1 Tax=Aurantiacibacter odishensis TaxID=1155476 RepID=UPI000E75B22C|nr:Flp family type IVb pilin [Aurantiacibacter odishensis]